MFTNIFDIATLLISSYFCLESFKRTGYGTRYIMFLIFFIVMVLPLYLDYLIGKPVYSSWALGIKNYGFILSYDDGLTRLLYDIYILLFQWMILYYKVDFERDKYILEDRILKNDHIIGKSRKIIIYLLIIFSILPILLTIILPINDSILITWGWRELNLFGATTSEYYYSIEKLSYIGLISSLLLFMMRPKDFAGTLSRNKYIFYISKPFFLVFAICNVCIESKRSVIIFGAAILISFLFDIVSKRKIKYVFLLGLVAVSFIVVMSIYVKTTHRNYSTSAFDALYTTLRIDYFRDDTTKMLIYSIFNGNDIKVLDFPFQSYIMQLGYIFPLELLDIPRLGYNTYFTTALVNVPLSAGLSYTTTSMFDEMIANFGLIGFITAPIFTIWIAKLADNYNVIVKTFIVAGYVLLVMYSMNYIMWFLETVALIVILSKFTFKYGKKTLIQN